MMSKKIDMNLIPENIKDIAWRANPDNVHVRETERSVALARLENIAAYCSKAIEVLGHAKGRR